MMYEVSKLIFFDDKIFVEISASKNLSAIKKTTESPDKFLILFLAKAIKCPKTI